MKNIKRALALLLCLCMVLSYVPIHGHAAGSEPNITISVDKTEVEVGDTVIVKLGIKEMCGTSLAFGFDFDNTLLEATSVPTKSKSGIDFLTYDPDTEGEPSGEYDYEDTLTPTAISTKKNMNDSGHFGVAYAYDLPFEACYSENDAVITIKFTALANGTVEFEMFEDTAGTDGYKDEWTSETTVIIGGTSEPECDHATTKLVPNTDGTHNVVCANTECGETVTENETCSGTDDDDHTTAVQCECGNTVTAATEHTYTQNLRGTLKTAGDCKTKAVYAVKCDYCAHESDTLTVEGEYGDHTYGTLIPAQEAVHTQTEQKAAVAAHYLCKCGKYFTEGKVETTLEALTGDTPVHTEGDPVKNTEESTDASCTEGGTLVEDIFCTECGAFIRKVTTPVAATCTTGTVEYTWGTDNATCKAQLICEHGTVLKEEEVTTTSKVTTEADCQTAKVVTYYADFANFDDTSIPVTGEKDMTKHVGTTTISYRDNENGTHTAVSTYECGHAVDGDTVPCSDGNDADELCDSCGNDLHVCVHHHYKYINNGMGHVSVCSCGEELDNPEEHKLGENDLCVCGAWLYTLDYNGGVSIDEPGKDSYEFYAEPGYVLDLAWNEELCKEVYAKEGYVFDGFAYDAEGQNPVVNPTELSSTTTVYLAWACNHDETVHKYTYTDNRDGTHTVKCACGEIIDTDEEHTYDETTHACDCGKVETFTLTFDLNGGTLADEYAAELAAFVQDGKFVIPDVRYGIANPYSKFYYEGVLLKEGYHITGFEDEDGNFHSLESDDTFTMEGDTTLTVIWEVNTYTLTVNVLATGEEVELTVPYGANLLEVLAQAAEEGKIPALGQRFRVNDEYQNGENIPYRYSYNVGDEDEPDWIVVDGTTTMPAENFAIDQDHGQIGWVFSNLLDGRVGAEYFDFEDGWLGSGWHYIEENYDDVEGGAWYYFYEGTGDWEGWFFRAEGLTRVPYPTEAINGITYGPDADALASDPNFIDKDEAWFAFDYEGKFLYDANGYDGPGDIAGKLVNGMLAWHPGMVEVTEGVYCYFIGDETNGGNVMATGDVYVMRNTTDRAFVIGGIYTFGADGKLCEYDGITDMANGTKRYYEDAQLMIGNGLTKVGENFIYVRSNGELVVNAEYYIPAGNKYNVVSGFYSFDADGFMIDPVISEKDGVYYENGALYYYENGKIGYNKGLIEVTEIWHSGDGDREITAVIYVRSNGQLATGYYYVTNVENYDGSIASGTKLLFGNDGTLVILNGVHGDYYYVDSQIAYGAGVVEIETGKYIYVKSDGTVVKDRNYWITNVGDTGVVAKLYTFDAEGFFTPELVDEAKDGIVDGYYYENGAIAYGKGLMEYNGGYIYVRSNGQVATGKYWITTTNGLMENGYYIFGEDGMMIIQ